MSLSHPPERWLPAAQGLGWTLVHSLWQGIVAAALLAVVLGLLRGRSAAARHAACLLTLLAMVVAAGVTLRRVEHRLALAASSAVKIPNSKVPAFAPEPPATRDVLADVEPNGFGPTMPAAKTVPPAISAKQRGQVTLTPAWRTRLDHALPWLAVGWGLGVLAISLRHLAGWWKISVWRRKARPARSELQAMLTSLCARYGLRTNAVRLLETAEVGIPMLAGFFRPVLLLPVQALTGLSARELEVILAHELAHLARGDTWINPVLLAVETMFFYHPAVWWIARRARTERELAADDLTLRVCGDRRVYAGALARLADFQQPFSDLALAATGGRGTLLFRIRRILQPAVEPVPSAPSVWGLAMAPTALALLAGTVWMTRVKAEESTVVNVAPGQSIQAAIDAAPGGAVIRLGEGEWQENLVIAKPLTLEGAGWEKTRLVAGEVPPPSQTDNLDYQVRYKAARTAEEKRVLATERIQMYDHPTVWVRDAREVTLRGLRVQGRPSGSPRDGRTLAVFQRGGARVEECAFVGPAATGLSIGRGADVEVKDSLVAAVTSDGIDVSGRDEETPGEPGRLHLIGSEVRNAYYAGIVLGHGCDSTVIERSRISGSAWHGIRYDDASPTITGCTIFAHARCGIYASGRTKATIRGNLFYRNEMSGIWALQGNADVIEGNTFMDNLRESMGASGAKPTVTRNIFVGSPVAIVCSSVNSRNGPPSEVGDPVLSENIFWNNKAVLQKGGGDKVQPAPPGSLEADPRFRDAAKLDFALAPGSPALNKGAVNPLPPTGSWPLLAEEKAIIPSGDTRDSRSWKFNAPRRNPVVVTMPTPRPAPGAQPSATPSPTAPVVAATPTPRPERTDGPGALVLALSSTDGAAKQTAIERLRGELSSGDLSRERLALAALMLVTENRAKFDQTSFRPALRQLVASPEADVRRDALLGLGYAGPSAEDLDLALARVDDPSAEVRSMVPGALTMLSDENLTGRVSDALLKLLDRNDPGMARGIWGNMWTAKISPELEKRVVAASYTDGGTTGYSDVFYYALIRHFTKREPTVSRLIELSTSADQTNVGYFCYWGLLRGVDVSQQARVCDFALKTLNDAALERYWGMSLGLVAAYGTSAQVAPLREWLAVKTWIKGDLRKATEDTIAKAEARPVVNEAAATGVEQQQQEEARERRVLEINQSAAHHRASQDRINYDETQLREIENLYQVANQKGLRNEESRASLRQLLDKYDKANRTGCATLYYGQGSEGTERLEYLTRAVEKFSDCYYFDGCQVGGFGRYLLATTFWESGEKDRARALVAELRTTYRDATDHRGRPMTVLADDAEKFFAQKS